MIHFETLKKEAFDSFTDQLFAIMAENMSVYVENGGWGATYGVPIGALIIEKYLKGELSPESEQKANDIQKRRIEYGIHER